MILSESGRLRTGRRGEAIKEYPAGGTEYTGQVNGSSMQGSMRGGNSGNWGATRLGGR